MYDELSKSVAFGQKSRHFIDQDELKGGRDHMKMNFEFFQI